MQHKFICFLFGCKVWTLIFREDADIRGEKWWKAAEDCIMKRFSTVYSLPNHISMSKSRQMIWSCDVALMEQMRNA